MIKKVLVTGSSRGLGLAICRQLLAQNWHVIGTSRRCSAKLAQLAREHPGRLEFYAADLGRLSAVKKLSRQIGRLEGLDGFVANAAWGAEGLLTLSADRAICHCVQVNLVATMMLARQVIKGMLGLGGSLVFISSVATRTGFAGLSVYAATKGALLAFSRSIAREYGARNVRSNCVLPGFMPTDMTRSLTPAQRRQIRHRTPLGRWADPEEVAASVCFLLSDQARFITGTELVVDGGMTA